MLQNIPVVDSGDCTRNFHVNKKLNRLAEERAPPRRDHGAHLESNNGVVVLSTFGKRDVSILEIQRVTRIIEHNLRINVFTPQNFYFGVATVGTFATQFKVNGTTSINRNVCNDTRSQRASNYQTGAGCVKVWSAREDGQWELSLKVNIRNTKRSERRNTAQKPKDNRFLVGEIQYSFNPYIMDFQIC